ncbi:hypothetical protein AB833_05010 [Chromatiales bacterium (ex Bugula neritina AB1)]|nr:hypothetical protein AB833_05010 [Chromatiales bacterium (ex Bugula neritina AB1)]
MVDGYEKNGVNCQFVGADDGLRSSVFTRDSSFMTPWGTVIASIQTPPRRQDYSVVSEFCRKVEIPIRKWVTEDQFEGGDFVIIRPEAKQQKLDRRRKDFFKACPDYPFI